MKELVDNFCFILRSSLQFENSSILRCKTPDLFEHVSLNLTVQWFELCNDSNVRERNLNYREQSICLTLFPAPSKLLSFGRHLY